MLQSEYGQTNSEMQAIRAAESTRYNIFLWFILNSPLLMGTKSATIYGNTLIAEAFV